MRCSLPPLVALVALALTACADPPRPPVWQRPTPPGVEDLREAVRALEASAREGLGDDGDWPPHLPRSRDFPERPLARTAEVEDLGRVGADTEGLSRALESAVRDLMTLRLALDEVAVPVTLRPAAGGAPPAAASGTDAGQPPPATGPPAPGGGAAPPAHDPLWATRGQPPRAGLLVEAWIDRKGRVRARLMDLVLDEEVARGASRPRD